MKKKDQAWAQDPKEEVEESWESVADPNRREWDLRYRFYRPTPDRYGLMCGTCKYCGHMTRDCPTNWGRDPRFLEPNCTIDGEYEHKARWLTAAGDRKIGIERIDALLPPTRKAKSPGNAVPLLLTNSANKTIRIKRAEELALAYPVREVDQVRIRI